jgi:hypothetical protein
MAAIACAPPILNTLSTPAMLAATMVTGLGEPDASAGVHNSSSGTPATLAGTADIITVDGRGADPPGT